jgi:hypothetical protein
MNATMRQYAIIAGLGLALLAFVALVLAGAFGLDGLPPVRVTLQAAGAVALLFAFAFWVQLMIRYNAQMYGVVTRHMRPDEQFTLVDYVNLLLPLGDPARLSGRVTSEGAEQLAECSLLRRRIWMAVAVSLFAAWVVWLAKG